MSKLLPSTSAKRVSVKLVKSLISCTQKQIASVRGLGLKKIGSEVTVDNTIENRGMIHSIIFLLDVKEAK